MPLLEELYAEKVNEHFISNQQTNSNFEWCLLHISRVFIVVPSMYFLLQLPWITWMPSNNTNDYCCRSTVAGRPGLIAVGSPVKSLWSRYVVENAETTCGGWSHRLLHRCRSIVNLSTCWQQSMLQSTTHLYQPQIGLSNERGSVVRERWDRCCLPTLYSGLQ